MAANTFAEFDTTIASLGADLATRILAQGDWAELTALGTSSITTLGAASSAGASSFTIASTSMSHALLSVGSVIIIDKGTASEERMIVSARSSLTTMGATSHTSGGAVFAHANGATVHYGGRLFKATTTRGAQMVVDLFGTTHNLADMGLDVWRTHDGTTGADRLKRYIAWRGTVGTRTVNDPVHVTLAVGKEHLMITVEGPRGGEAGAADATSGSGKQTFFLGDLVPYFASDTVPAVVCVGQAAAAITDYSAYVHVSRNQGNTQSWVQARLATLSANVHSASGVNTVVPQTPVQKATADGNTYYWPYVVVEVIDGLRGRLTVLNGGWNNSGVSGEPVSSAGQRATIGGVPYIGVATQKASASSYGFSPFGAGINIGNHVSPIVMVPTA